MDAPRALLLILALAIGHVAAAAAAAAAAAQTVEHEWTSLAAARQLLDTVSPNDTQFSGHLDGSVSPTATDFPLDSGPLAQTATGWEPEGVHLTLWGPDAVLVSWQTGEPRTGPTSDPPAPYDAAEVEGLVRYGTAPDQLNQTATDGKNVVYSYVYNEAAGGMTYHSPILHHVLLTGLQPGQQYWYRVGGRLANGSAAPDGREWSFRLPAGPPAELRVGVLGDPGQTSNTSQNLGLLAEAKPDVVFILGDLTYADLYYSNQTNSNWSFTAVPASQQLRWDSWARLTEPLLATVPAVLVGGNHEAELQPDVPGHPTFTAFNARYPQPQNRDSIETAPNLSDFYLNASNSKQFVNNSDYLPANAFFSHQLPWLKVIALNNYLPYDPASPQYRWAAAELEAVNRTETPWMVVLMHGSPRTTYAESWGLWKELEEFMSFYEPLFYEAGVDMVLSGHVHSYERSLPMFNYSVDPCGAQYITVGDGGNVEGPEQRLIDKEPPAYCSDPRLYEQPMQQATTTGQPLLTFLDGRLCPLAQPAYSAFRDPSFGHGLLVLHNASSASWSWLRNKQGAAVAVDSVVLHRTSGCKRQQAAAGKQQQAAGKEQQGTEGQRHPAERQQQAQPSAATGDSSSSGGPGPGVLVLVAGTAAAAALQDA